MAKQISVVGKLLKEGKSSEEIRKVVVDFPENLNEQYFENLGYKEVTAKELLRISRKNNSNPAKVKKTLSERKVDFIKSANPDTRNIIIDTCVLGYVACHKIISKSERVVVLLRTITEFDKVVSEKKDNIVNSVNDKKFVKSIKEFSKKILVDPKFKLVPFKGTVSLTNSEYSDNQIIEYLIEQPVSERPTILTADVNLCCKAKCFGLEYMLYIPKKEALAQLKMTVRKRFLTVARKKEVKLLGTELISDEEEIESVEIDLESAEEEVRTELNSAEKEMELPKTDLISTEEEVEPVKTEIVLTNAEVNSAKQVVTKKAENVFQRYGKIMICGVRLSYMDRKISIDCKNNQNAEIYYVMDGKTKMLIEAQSIDDDIDYLVIIARTKIYGVKVVKCIVKNGAFKDTEYLFQYVNQLYELEEEFSKEIIENVKNFYRIPDGILN